MIRNVIGSILALIGATAAVWSPFRDWYDGRQGRDYRIQDLFTGITSNEGELFTSLLLPMAFAALLTLIGLLLRSRLVVALAGVVVLGFTVLWMVRQGQAAGSLTAGGDGLGLGVALSFGGGVLLLLAAALMSGRRALRRRREEPYDEEPPGHVPAAADDWGPYGRDPNSTGPYPGQDRYDAGTHYGDEEPPPRHTR
ncbi:hypothetical protein GLX30_20305 [Streptomyces sp. Tu 2975]|uniref:hypothetical protein n=1 Tax=Streptomyces sp. Tu 2975 TaxID=2676871 RepID=UPI001357961E|nr:hypothetical protein [Streptomyces sp. Tu 2975]QIP85982.1 hypothetical protein GLX30_20305 [Streptomyces sp. Tu 2975]